MKSMQTENIKDKAHKLLDNLPDSATWEDLMYRIYVREAIEAGIKDSDQGHTVVKTKTGTFVRNVHSDSRNTYSQFMHVQHERPG
jgi:hypothetical protein